MKKKSNRLSCSLLVLLSWAFPLYTVIYNQMNPSYESALGVALGFLLGSVLHGLLFALWFAIRRSKLQKAELVILGCSLGIMIILTIVSDGGTLSKVGA